MKPIRRHGVAAKITIDGSEANGASIHSYHTEHATAITIGQVKYLHKVVNRSHRGVKQIKRPMQGVKSFDAAQ